MSTAIEKILAAGDAEYRHLKATDPGRFLAHSPGGLPINISSLGAASSQLEHYKNWAFVAIRAISHRIAGLPIFVGRKPAMPTARSKTVADQIEPLASHPLLDALARPNRLQTSWHLMVSTIASLELTGRSSWWTPLNAKGDVEIWPIPSTWIEPADSSLSRWQFRLPGEPVPKPVPDGELVYFHLPDPSNVFGCMSPLQSQALAVATDHELQTAQHSAFARGLFPTHLLRIGKQPGITPGESTGLVPELTSTQRKEILDALGSLYSGTRNYGKPIIADRLIESVEKLSMSPDEMSFLESGNAVKSRIMQSFGVNPIVVGEIVGANRAQAVVALQQFDRTCVGPLTEMLASVLTSQFASRFADNLLVWFGDPEVDDAELELQRWEIGLRTGSVTRNEYRAWLNLEGLPGLDEVVEPISFAARAQPATQPDKSHHVHNGTNHSRLAQASNGR